MRASVQWHITSSPMQLWQEVLAMLMGYFLLHRVELQRFIQSRVEGLLVTFVRTDNSWSAVDQGYGLELRFAQQLLSTCVIFV
jgi:hypothetical protein